MVSKPKKLSPGEELFALHLRANKIDFMREYRFHDTRDWRADFYIAQHSILIEIDGGNTMAVMGKNGPVAIGRHTQKADYSKMNAATVLGYKVLRFTPSMVKSGEAIETVLMLLDSQV